MTEWQPDADWLMLNEELILRSLWANRRIWLKSPNKVIACFARHGVWPFWFVHFSNVMIAFNWCTWFECSPIYTIAGPRCVLSILDLLSPLVFANFLFHIQFGRNVEMRSYMLCMSHVAYWLKQSLIGTEVCRTTVHLQSAMNICSLEHFSFIVLWMGHMWQQLMDTPVVHACVRVTHISTSHCCWPASSLWCSHKPSWAVLNSPNAVQFGRAERLKHGWTTFRFVLTYDTRISREINRLSWQNADTENGNKYTHRAGGTAIYIMLWSRSLVSSWNINVYVYWLFVVSQYIWRRARFICFRFDSVVVESQQHWLAFLMNGILGGIRPAINLHLNLDLKAAKNAQCMSSA